MKKALVLSIVLVAAVFTLGSVNKVYASSGNPSTTAASDNYGFGGQGGMMGGTQQGLLHDEMVIVVAEKLGITVEDLNARLADGETMYSVAIAEGLSNDEAIALMADARSQAIDQAVANGDLTQAQADWMKTRSQFMGANGANGATGTRGMMGGARGANGTGTGTCIGVYTNN
ncbi:MAG: hypothetical protein FP831_10145 [Anaerolineae bacterium]|jgi:hypothetical protein|nr:hypothetical protein [Anaerolineae bacterium]HCS40320.1 hypothetical protein [Anaerolineaceae bacterium]